MEELVERIRREGRNLGDGILKVDGFINHQIDSGLTMAMGKEFVRRFRERRVGEVTKVITAAVSGIGPGLATAAELDVPVIYARKTRPITMPDRVLRSVAPSHTKGGESELIVSPEFLTPEDRVLIIDDFLATGNTLRSLVDLIEQSGARLLGIGCVIEKSFQEGRDRLEGIDVPILTLAVVEEMDGDTINVRSGRTEPTS